MSTELYIKTKHVLLLVDLLRVVFSTVVVILCTFFIFLKLITDSSSIPIIIQLNMGTSADRRIGVQHDQRVLRGKLFSCQFDWHKIFI